MIDPVCGMEVNQELCKFRETYKGYGFFFCSDACQRAFLKNPERHPLARLVFRKVLKQVDR